MQKGKFISCYCEKSHAGQRGLYGQSEQLRRTGCQRFWRKGQNGCFFLRALRLRDKMNALAVILSRNSL